MRNRNYSKSSYQPSSQLRKRLLWVLLVVLVIGGILVILEKTGVTNFIKLHHTPAATSSGPTPEQKQQEDQANAASKQQAIQSDKSTTIQSSVPTASNKSITLSAQQETNNTVTVFTKLPGYSDGSCTLTVTNADKTVTQTANVIYQSEASTCAGFSVPIDSLGKGMWTLKLTVTSNGTSDSKNITYQVK